MNLPANVGLQDRDTTATVPNTLTDTLNAWEQNIRGACEEANATVNDTVAGMAAFATDSAHAMGGAVEDSSRALGRVFDVSRHYRRHPWFTVGVILVIGLVVVRWASRRDERCKVGSGRDTIAP